jgi:hypothetical protein
MSSMAYSTADFHYLTILRELEKETTRLERRRKSSERGQAHRTSRVFRDLFGELGDKVAGDSITLKLKASGEKLLETELASADLIRELTEGRPRYERIAAGDWPPVVPAPRMVERFTALTIGQHSEDPSQPLSAHAAQAFKSAVLPALAWGLVSSLYELSEDLRSEAQAELARLFAGPRKPHQDELILNDEERVGFLYLRMVEAWFSLLDSAHPWGVAKAHLEEARHKLSGWLKRPLTELDTLLWESLGEHYTSQQAGAQRARVVSQAGGHTASFIRHRLQLFTAATDPKLRKFRLQTEHSLGKAVVVRFDAEDMSPAKADAAAHEACGAAFWLARACFGKHIGDQTQNIPADLASERVLLLLLRAAVHLKHDAQLQLTCVRYAAGFATNPRYVRSGAVLDNQERLVDLYAKMPGARRALTQLFRGRIAWHDWKARRTESPQAALNHYAAALKEHNHAEHGFDAEAPIHFFPELIVLLDQARKRKTREVSTLRAVDFITQRNYGIYFDIETEERTITAGLKEYADFKAMNLRTLKGRLRTKLAASDALGGKDPELLAAYQEVVDELHPSAPDYREHIADLLSMPGVTIRRAR